MREREKERDAIVFLKWMKKARPRMLCGPVVAWGPVPPAFPSVEVGELWLLVNFTPRTGQSRCCKYTATMYFPNFSDS